MVPTATLPSLPGCTICFWAMATRPPLITRYYSAHVLVVVYFDAHAALVSPSSLSTSLNIRTLHHSTLHHSTLQVLQAAEHAKKVKQSSSQAGSSKSANKALPPAAITKTLDFRDTFLDAQHVVDAFPSAKVTFPSGPSGSSVPSAQLKPPFRLTITTPTTPAAGGAGAGSEEEEKGEKDSKETVSCVAYAAPNPGPYPQVLYIPKPVDVYFQWRSAFRN